MWSPVRTDQIEDILTPETDWWVEWGEDYPVMLMLNYQPSQLTVDLSVLCGIWLDQPGVVLDLLVVVIDTSWPWPPPGPTSPRHMIRQYWDKFLPHKLTDCPGPGTIIIICSSKHGLLLDIGPNQPGPLIQRTCISHKASLSTILRPAHWSQSSDNKKFQ